jgi:hypothetical protein
MSWQQKLHKKAVDGLGRGFNKIKEAAKKGVKKGGQQLVKGVAKVGTSFVDGMKEAYQEQKANKGKPRAVPKK